jgi:hypothetical protein
MDDSILTGRARHSWRDWRVPWLAGGHRRNRPSGHSAPLDARLLADVTHPLFGTRRAAEKGVPSTAALPRAVILSASTPLRPARCLASNANAIVSVMRTHRVRGRSAPRSPQQGADTIVWLATLPDDGPTGRFFRDRRVIEW